jgi:hypothetical protein
MLQHVSSIVSDIHYVVIFDQNLKLYLFEATIKTKRMPDQDMQSRELNKMSRLLRHFCPSLTA